MGYGKIRPKGFSLIELTIVLLISGLLLGTMLKPLGAKLDQSKRQRARQQLEEIYDALIGFAIVNGRLPCPSTKDSAGQEPAVCTMGHGFVPSAALSISGYFDKAGLLLDPWNNPIRYSVSLADSNVFGTPGRADFVSTDEMLLIGPQNLKPDLVICARITGDSCTSQNIRANQVPAVIYSQGKSSSNTEEERENADDDNVFSSMAFSQLSGSEYDDILIWLSDNVLFARMIQAGAL